VKSINRQMVGIYITIIALTIGAPLIINFCFLGYFYLHEKENAMISTYDLVNRAAVENKLDDEIFLDELEKAHANYSISVVVMDSAANILLTTAHDTADLNSQLYYAMFGQQMQGSSGIEKSGENYVIKQQMDHRLGEEYLVLWGTLDDGNIIMLRSAVEGIRESTGLTNRFLIYIGVLALLLSGLATTVLTRRITKPILALTDISKRMIGLDFQAKYHSQKKRNEVDVLGEHMNELSETLEKTIVELKQANHELQADIAIKEETQRRQQEFIANVSHELKTPIALIQGYAEGLAEGITDDEESREFYCDVIIDEAKRMNRMVLSMISLNQIESGNNEMEYDHFDIVALLEGMVQSMQILLQQNDITLSFAHDKEIFVYADEYSMEQVISNYLSNAIHHAKYDKKIDIKLTPKEKILRVSVFNTGDAIPEESMGQIWDKFYKVDKARTREYGGTGIGLSIVKAIMESMGQAYGVINHENGVEFWFEVEC
jgi:two-component system, OmpR family, sensor histidine kinase VanS